MIEDYRLRVEKGEMTGAKARGQALERLRHMRFADNGYIWINDTTEPYPRMIMHPVKPSLEGRVMDDSSYRTAVGMQIGMEGAEVRFDSERRHFFKVFLEVVRKGGSGFVEYHWHRPASEGVTSALYPKKSYVRMFDPWGWIIGTGIYIDDVYAQMTRLKWTIISMGAAVFMLALAGTYLLMRTITRPIHQLVTFAASVAGGDINATIQGRFKGEMSQLKKAISQMMDELRDRMHEAEIRAKEAEAAHKALKKSEEKYRILVENAREAIFVAQDGMIRFANQSTCELVGYSIEELTSVPFTGFLHPDDRKMVLDRHYRRIQGIKVESSYCFRVINRAGNVKWGELKSVEIEWEGQPATLNFLSDITEQIKIEQEREKLEKRLRQSQKIEALGTLTGGVAHDFNNILSIIMGYAELVRAELPEEHPAQKGLCEISTAGARARDLVRQLLTFSRREEEEKSALDIALTVKECMRMIRSTTPSFIDIQEQIRTDLPMVLANPTQIHQLIINLCKNASDAMAENGGGPYCATGA